MARITTGMQGFSQIFSALRDGVMWLFSCVWACQVWLWTGLYRLAVAVYDMLAKVVVPVWRFWARIQAAFFSALVKVVLVGYGLLQKGWQFCLACWHAALSWLYSWIKPLWLPLREDLLPLWHFVRTCVATLINAVAHWFSLVVKLLARLQSAVVYYLQIPATYTGLWQSAVISLVGTLLQKVWAVPNEIEGVLSTTPFAQKWHRWPWHAVGALTFLLSGLVMWPYLYGVVVLPFSPHHLQWFVLAPAMFFPIRGLLRRGVDFFSARLPAMTANVMHEASSLVFSLAGVWLANRFLLAAAPAASPFLCAVSAATWAWFYLARPQAPKWVWYPGVLAVCAGPLLYYLAMMGFIVVASIASVYLSVLVFTHAMQPLVYELVLSGVAIFGIGLCGYAMVKEMPTRRTWVTVLLAMVFGPPIATVLYLGLPYLVLLLVSNSFLLYTLLGMVASCILLLGARYLDRWVYGALADKKPNALNIFSSMTVLYANVFFSLYAFCFVVPTFAMKVLPVMMVGLLSMGLTFVYTIYAVDRLSDMLHTFSPKQADHSGTRLWFFSALFISIAGNLGFTMPMFSWLPVVVTNITGGVLIGLGVGLLSAFSAVCFLRSFFPRVEIGHLHRCLVSGSVLVLAPWGLWHVVHMPLSSIVITLVWMKVVAIWMACRSLWSTIPVFYQQDPSSGLGGSGSGPVSSGGEGPSHKPGDKGDRPDHSPSAPPLPDNDTNDAQNDTFPPPSAPPFSGNGDGETNNGTFLESTVPPFLGADLSDSHTSTSLISRGGHHSSMALPSSSLASNGSMLPNMVNPSAPNLGFFDSRAPNSFSSEYLAALLRSGVLGRKVPFSPADPRGTVDNADYEGNRSDLVVPSAPPLPGSHQPLPVAYPVINPSIPTQHDEDSRRGNNSRFSSDKKNGNG